MSKPILCLDFDGVIHSYSSGWKGATIIPDAMVPGALHFIWDAQEYFTVAIYSSRSGQEGGIAAMQDYLRRHAMNSFDEGPWCDDPHLGFLGKIKWPTEKPPAMVSLDDRAITFRGKWPSVVDLMQFQPWTKTKEPPCYDCKHSVAHMKVMEVMGEDMDMIDYIECRRMPPVPTFWGTSFPKATSPCGEFEPDV